MITHKVRYFDSIENCIKDASVAIIITEWDEFRRLSPEFFVENMKSPVIVDGRKMYDFKLFSDKLKYLCIGERRKI